MSYSPKQVTQLTNLYNKYIPDIEPDMLVHCLTCRDYSIGRIYHKIGEFDLAIDNYQKVISFQKGMKKVRTYLLILQARIKKRV